MSVDPTQLEGQVAPPATPAAIPDPAAAGLEGFDWGAFFNGVPEVVDDGEPVAPVAPVANAQALQNLEDDQEPTVLAELRELRKTTTQIAARQAESDRQTRLDQAVDEWKKTATPAQLALADILYKSQSLEELRANETLVRQAASKVEAGMAAQEAEIKAKVERELQAQYGFPVAPSFQPIPRKDVADQMLSEGNLDGAAAVMLEGLFSS